MNAATIRTWLTGTLGGRALIVGVGIKIVVLSIRAVAGSSALLEAVDTIGSVGLLVAAIALSIRLFVRGKRLVLWRVRRKLTLSYIFIGFVPALLIILFFAISGLLLFFNIGSYVMRSRVTSLVDEARTLAEMTALELQRARTPAEMTDIVTRRQKLAAARYPFVSFAVIPERKGCGSGGSKEQDPPYVGSKEPAFAPSASAGPWAHIAMPTAVPAWVPCSGHSSLIAYIANSETNVAARAVSRIDNRSTPAVVVDIPLSETLARNWSSSLGVAPTRFELIDNSQIDRAPASDTTYKPAGSSASDTKADLFLGPANIVYGQGPEPTQVEWLAFLDYNDWETGRAHTMAATFRMSLASIYRQISTTSGTSDFGAVDLGRVFLFLLAVVGGLFLVIQFVAFGVGLALARSITGSVHELFVGTERVRRGDFTHKIAIRSRDQLGDLAESFNSMTASIEDLLQQKAEKERLEQELRIARGIQMSLLPQGPLNVPGVALAGHCEPAREVGGDYYDFLKIDDHRLGILIADVAGKGTSAAFYMAELKGIVLSLSGLHTSPRQLLIDANRIISRHLDSRSFITMTYAVIDLQARTLTHARAGHCPLIHLPGPGAGSRAAEVLAPDGLVLGLQIDEGQLFNRLLVEESRPLCPGDLFVLYTDGVTEAMNAQGDLFGEARLSEAVQAYGAGPFDQLRERILQEIHTFVGSAPQQDDLTMVLCKIDEPGYLPAKAGSHMA